jgi:N-formylglutamate amidohydrolase
MILHIPHASRLIPPEVRSVIALPDNALATELLKISDWFTDDLFGSHAQGGDVALVYPVSRLVVDPERFPDDAHEAMAQVGMGAVYTRTSDGSELRAPPTAEERELLLEAYYHRHHRLLSDAVDAELKRTGRAVILDCHSFPSQPLPYEYDQSPDRPDICVGSDGYHTPARLIRAVEDQCRSECLSFALNRPFAGAIVPMAHYRIDANVRSIMIEVNRRLYLNEATGTRSKGYEACRRMTGRLVDAIRNAGARRS